MSSYRPRKRFGQHFLASSDILNRLLSLIIPQDDQLIVEIGPGRGVLTRPLVRTGARLIAVEFDRDLFAELQDELGDNDRVEIVNTDFVKWQPPEQRFRLVGNIPYNITSPVIDWCCRYRERIIDVHLMVQRELARRLAASPGSKDWSPLSIVSQLHFEVKGEFDVPPDAFDPPPEVVSAVVTLRPTETPLPDDYPELARVVRASFAQRRKTLLNNLVPSFHQNAARIRAVLEALELPASVRAEELSIDQFLRLTRILARDSIV